MAGEDDIERLLREVEALEGGGAKQHQLPAERPGGEVAPAGDGATSKRVTWAVAAAVGGGVSGFVVGVLLGFLPWISPMSTAVGAAFGAVLVALLGGPPRWFDRSD